MKGYRFLTAWAVEAPIDRVWDVLVATERHPQWWNGVRSAVKLEPGDADGVGTLWRMQWRSALPYSLEFDSRTVRVERPHLIEIRASGELEGSGVWRLFAAPGSTAVLYSWDVETTRPWMKRLAPLARPAFAWNHAVVMRRGAHGLARELGVRLIDGG